MFVKFKDSMDRYTKRLLLPFFLSPTFSNVSNHQFMFTSGYYKMTFIFIQFHVVTLKPLNTQ